MVLVPFPPAWSRRADGASSSGWGPWLIPPRDAAARRPSVRAPEGWVNGTLHVLGQNQAALRSCRTHLQPLPTSSPRGPARSWGGYSFADGGLLRPGLAGGAGALWLLR